MTKPMHVMVNVVRVWNTHVMVNACIKHFDQNGCFSARHPAICFAQRPSIARAASVYLSPTGSVHASTLYNIVNIDGPKRGCPLVPVFACTYRHNWSNVQYQIREKCAVFQKQRQVAFGGCAWRGTSTSLRWSQQKVSLFRLKNRPAGFIMTPYIFHEKTRHTEQDGQ